MELKTLLLAALIVLFSDLLAFLFTKYYFTERFYFHGTLEYEKAFNKADHVVFGFLFFFTGPVALMMLPALFDKVVPSHHFGLALTKNLRFPNHHRSQ